MMAYSDMSAAHRNCVASNAEKYRLRAECKRLELAVEARHAECLKARHDDLLRRSHSHAKDGMLAALIRTIKGAERDSIVFNHDGTKLYER